ncbi:MAG: RNA polymerase sigma factor [Kribbellaceae bacterium]|nr:RNA polymerase sigma factor [Kribbellaceae bacterium]
MAEDCVQDAYAKALVHWRSEGVPRRPGAWLTTVATRRALEHRRRADVARRKLPLLIPAADAADQTFPDDRLRLIFTCCHPALSQEAQIALTLRLVCGLTSAEIAKAFLVKEATMQARITRAKQKISRTGIPYRIPHLSELPDRIEAVLDVVHLVYTTGQAAAALRGEDGHRHPRSVLGERGIELARMVRLLLPGSAEAAGLLAFLLLTEARRPAQVGAELVLMEDQDRSLWDRELIAEGLALVPEAVAPGGRFGLMAAIAAVHAEAECWEDTDWSEILGLYELLVARWPSPVVRLNRVVAVSYVEGPGAALEQLPDDPALATYPYLYSTRAELLRRLGRLSEARAAYEEALVFTTDPAQAAFLQRRLIRDV